MNLQDIRTLDSNWTVRPTTSRRVPGAVTQAGLIPATVPGVVHTDLLAVGLIDDPYLDTNERLQEWIGHTDWRYATTFDWADEGHNNVELAFGGLDTMATVILNGHTVLSSRNQHRSYRVPVKPFLREGSNDLIVLFAAPVPAADLASLELGYRPHVNHHPYNAIRKMASSFGWDWGIDTATSGIWKPIVLHSWSNTRIASVTTVPTVNGTLGELTATVTVERTGTSPVTLRGELGGVSTNVTLQAGQTEAVLTLQIDDVDLWWPVGYGEPNRYEFTLTASSSDTILDRIDRRIGFRTVQIDTAEDAEGTPFTLVINGQSVFVRGVNWIPDDAFPHRVDRNRYERRLNQALTANVNLIRVWGGGIFESEDFYDLADELGLLVWQDFLLACAAYAEEEPLRGEIVAEACEAVARLGAHPSLVLLNGNNENLWGYEEWNWKLRLEGRTWGSGYYHDLFPAIVAELAPHVAYTPGSPFSPNPLDHPNNELNGSMHLWEQWNRLDYPTYRDQRPRFVAEFGWQGPPAWSTLTESLTDSPLTPESPGMLVHQKAMEGNVKLTDGLLPHIPLPNNMPDWHWAMQLNQANAVSVAIEYFRSLTPHCQGAIVWQLNDCWPVVSWAAVDGYERPKPLLHAIRKGFADRLITVQPTKVGLEVVLVNDSAVAWSGTLLLDRLTYDGTTLGSERVEVDLPARGTQRITVPDALAAPDTPSRELLRASTGDTRGLWFFTEPRDSELEPQPFKAEAVIVPGGVDLMITATGLVRDLTVLADIASPDAEASDQLITLLPGEQATVHITTAGTVPSNRFLEADIIRTTNQLITNTATADVLS
ncbi:glycoside hydrolase family 2 protein [Marisediminicola senii]|uniref:glycoside hydrolase family 2 protein n=1 Tax=Marisediminicola senii TaxID=2711233 RepID=UPI0013EB47F6|nr:glycoside hydrolase family 2 protein [Marisediminicola senii]